MASATVVAGMALLPFAAATLRAGEAPPPMPDTAPVEQESSLESTLEKIWNLPMLYNNPDNPVLQKLAITGRYQGQYYWLDSDKGDADDWENRRWWIGADMTIFKKLRIKGDIEINDDLNPFYSNLYEAYISYKHSDEFLLGFGRREFLWSDEYKSSKYVLTFERSLLIEQLRPSTATGLWAAGKVGNVVYDAGVYFGSLDSELGSFDEGNFYTLSIGYDLAEQMGWKKSLVKLDWLINDTDAGSDVPKPYDHALSLNWSAEKDRYGIGTDIMYGAGEGSTADVFGISVIPTYDLTDKLELILRYQFATSDGDGLRAPGRYLGKAPNLTDGGVGDEFHAFYGGLNYYILDHRLKLMAGAEYATMSDGDGDGGAIDGWQLMTGIRLYF